VVAPVGGGGLLSGTAIAVTNVLPQARVFGAEPANADDAYRSFHAGHVVPVENSQTIADGLRTSLGSLTFPIIKERVTDILTVQEDEIVRAMRLVYERMKLVIEPSAAVALAGVLGCEELRGQRVGIILSGGNVDLDALPWKSSGDDTSKAGTVGA
jgi:threonine dehydratase